jgi:hypothetical protein
LKNVGFSVNVLWCFKIFFNVQTIILTYGDSLSL